MKDISPGEKIWDLAIIGGGVNGVGVARDAAGRGASAIVFEQGDLAEQTSSRSTKLIHGGLRYLEHFAFRLVRESLQEREVILAIAPHIVRPLRFVLPHRPGLRPRWMLAVGLLLYDHLGARRRLPPSRAIDLSRDEAGLPLQPRFANGFEYSDCWVDDARLVVLNARDAADRGALICARERVVKAERFDSVWRIQSDKRVVQARGLVNAAGAWVDQVLGDIVRVRPKAPIRLVRGSHIVVRKTYAHDRAYMLQNEDGRIVFVIPYEGDFTLIGTTDEDYSGDPAQVKVTPGEIAYLCACVSAHFRSPVRARDVVWSYSGVRPLYDDGASAAKDATRDYVLDLDDAGAPLLSIYGGKITTYRRLAEHALRKLAPTIAILDKPGWTDVAPLPGGGFAPEDIPDLLNSWGKKWPFLSAATRLRLLRSYGTLAEQIIGDARAAGDLGPSFGAGLTGAEVDYLMAREWAQTVDDIVWRRTKMGLHLTPEQMRPLQDYVENAVRASRSALL